MTRTLQHAWRLLIAVPVLVLLFVAGAWLPHKAEVDELDQRLSDADEAQQSLESLQAQVQRAQRDITDLEEAYKDRSQGLVPDTDPMPEIIGRIAELTDSAGVVDHELATLGQEQGDGYRAQRFRLSFSATFEAAYEILDAVENLRYLVSVQSMSLNPRPENHELEVRLELLAYARAAHSTTSTGEQP